MRGFQLCWSYCEPSFQCQVCTDRRVKKKEEFSSTLTHNFVVRCKYYKGEQFFGTALP